ncbi:hypothetical protein LOD99_6710 [Oopsacas minuta]|uniref:N-acetyltransferase domain-containing protein n=1 Tax=Oopsacas minuta TaxID=111878 RepID=A0AAV7JL27_9METZ|nr:hypothetical protein LOD99_6710 [Oopsacas minuta]
MSINNSDILIEDSKNSEATNSSSKDQPNTQPPNDPIVQSKEIVYHSYHGEEELEGIMQLMQEYLSEPYSIYTYRYFINNWPQLCIMASCEGKLIGTVVCQLEQMRIDDVDTGKGYIAMLAVREEFRKQRIGTTLVYKSIQKMIELGCEEVILEAEVTNKGALRLYSNMGFIKDRYLHRYYLNAVDAWRLKLFLKSAYKN